MSERQFARLMALLEEYARNVPAQIAAQREEEIRQAGHHRK